MGAFFDVHKFMTSLRLQLHNTLNYEQVCRILGLGHRPFVNLLLKCEDVPHVRLVYLQYGTIIHNHTSKVHTFRFEHWPWITN